MGQTPLFEVLTDTEYVCPPIGPLTMLTMAPIAQPYSQDACGVGRRAFAALG